LKSSRLPGRGRGGVVSSFSLASSIANEKDEMGGGGRGRGVVIYARKGHQGRR
jgi:hypothetical protein